MKIKINTEEIKIISDEVQNNKTLREETRNFLEKILIKISGKIEKQDVLNENIRMALFCEDKK